MDIRHLTGRITPDAFPDQKGRCAKAPATSKGSSFKEVLKEVSGLEFSGHALERLQDRSITMDETDMKRLQEAVSRAEQKGSRDSLILDGDQAFLVNIPNKTVVTAVDMMELRERVFTNIDSTVLTKQY